MNPPGRYHEIQQRVEAAGQGHVFQYWETLSTEQQQELIDDLKDLDFAYLERVFHTSLAATSGVAEGVKPVDNVLQQKDITPQQRQEWTQAGYQLIADGKAAVLLLAGGQGTRLGSSLPKGCYDIGLPSHKSLFQLQAERLLRLQQLAAQNAGGADGNSGSAARPLHWYIMTSPFTHADTLAHFEEHSFFGLQRGQVHFFQQGHLPALTLQGKLILERPSALAKAPDGNGGVYLALQRCGMLEHMAAAGVEALDCYCVDNSLARLGDPLFLGCCHCRSAAGGERALVGARAVAKAHPEERVGVFALKGPGPGLCVLEYSELDPSLASAADPATGQLVYNWSNICMHYFRVSWLREVAQHLLQGAGVAYHVARKQIPSVSGPVPGVKLELFIFDTFSLAGPSTALVEALRQEEFAPVKNAPGSETDSPDTAHTAVLQLHARWVEAAGGRLAEGVQGVEVSPLVSYAGEGLQELVAGRTLTSPYDDALQGVGLRT